MMNLADMLYVETNLPIPELATRLRDSNYDPDFIRGQAYNNIQDIIEALRYETRLKRLIPDSKEWRGSWDAARIGYSECLQSECLQSEEKDRALDKLDIEIFYISAPKRAMLITAIADTLGPLAAVLSFGIIWADDVMFDIRRAAAKWYLQTRIPTVNQ